MAEDYVAGRDQKVVVHVDKTFRPLMGEFLKNVREDISLLLQAVDAGDFEAIGFTGHRMKGVGEIYGFSKITEVGACLEKAAADGLSEEVRRLVAGLSDHLDRAEILYIDVDQI